MATSVIMAAATDRKAANPNEQPSFPQGQDHPPIRRSSGRRRKSETSMAGAGQKKKEPQRGMGVAKLEHIILQEEWERMTANHHTVAADHQFSKMAYRTQNQGSYIGFHGEMGLLKSDLQFRVGDGCLDHSEFWVKNGVGGLSKELSSTPNGVNCYFQHCSACHKKKKVGDCGFLGLNIRDNHNITKEENDENLASKLPPQVVAVHRKGSSCGGTEGGRVVMQYEFFPSSSSSSGKADSSEISSFSKGGFDAPCLDLSLKLSY